MSTESLKLQLIERLLELSKLEHRSLDVPRAGTSLAACAAQAVEQAGARAAQRRVTLQLREDGAALRGPWDAELLTLALSCLIDNAIDFSPDGAVVRVGVAGRRVTVNGVTATVRNRSFSASVPLTLGLNTLQVAARDRVGNQGTASITLTRTAASQLKLLSGNNQSGPIQALLPQPITVQVNTPEGTPAANRTVVFKVAGDDAAQQFRIGHEMGIVFFQPHALDDQLIRRLVFKIDLIEALHGGKTRRAFFNEGGIDAHAFTHCFLSSTMRRQASTAAAPLLPRSGRIRSRAWCLFSVVTIP